MSVDVARDKPPDEKVEALSENDASSSSLSSQTPQPTTLPLVSPSSTSPSDELLRTDDSAFNGDSSYSAINASTSEQQDPVSAKTSTSTTTPNDLESTPTAQPESATAEEIPEPPPPTAPEPPKKRNNLTEALEKRKHSILELVSSEESYVRRLKTVYELYMPAPYRMPRNTDPSTPATPSVTSVPLMSMPDFEELAKKLPPGGPVVPEDLVARWRILWGNWMQLYEWHTGFCEKMKTMLEEDPDDIAGLFCDSRFRMRTIYSKYCENHIKAAHIAEQHKDFFEEWRRHVGEKEDVVSLLMQPVQRIMRYQLPLSAIVEATAAADLPSLESWQRARSVMREIPRETQLILEASRIDGFPGVITALGNLRIRSNLNVAALTCAEYNQVVRHYAKSLNFLSSASFTVPAGTSACTSTSGGSAPPVRNSAGTSLLAKLHLQSTSTPEEQAEEANAEEPQTPHRNRFLHMEGLAQPQANLTTSLAEAGDPDTIAVNLPPPAPLMPGGHKYVVYRMFLFERMILLTEEVKAKRKGTSSDAFSESTYQFRTAINVNKMKFEPYWFLCDPTPEPSTTVPTTKSSLISSVSSASTSSNTGVSPAISGNSLHGSQEGPGPSSNFSDAEMSEIRATLEHMASDDLRFALWDQTPGRDVVYIIDPQVVEVRSAWVVHFRHLMGLKQKLLLALEDPTRYGGAESDWTSAPGPPTDIPPPRSAKTRDHTASVSAPQGSTTPSGGGGTTRKWPSFIVRRPGRLGSTSSTTTTEVVSSGPLASHVPRSKPKASTPAIPTSAAEKGGLPRSLSAERQRMTLTGSTSGGSMRGKARQAEGGHQKSRATSSVTATNSPRRKSSSAGETATNTAVVARTDSVESTGGADQHRNSMGLQKTKKVFSNLFFGKHSKKGRGSATTHAGISGSPLPPQIPRSTAATTTSTADVSEGS